MYCEQLNIKPIPVEISNEIISFVNDQIKNNASFAITYGRYNEGEEKDFIKRYGESGKVSFYFMPGSIHEKLKEFYANVEEFKNCFFQIQIVAGGDYVGPHIDDSSSRTKGELYILKAGGTNVLTEWWSLKDEFKDTIVPEATAIPYDKLNKIESHKLNEQSWYRLTFNQLHSVQNQESLRIAIAALRIN